ncbi:MAG TPA: carboxypeptidase-like regulatory domain-containing protein [Tepidisphaeraceae bacterium]|nr:carboxypeptidase-like regulatory domain-containing protein [Tepidisphaeraceae bacterium]
MRNTMIRFTFVLICAASLLWLIPSGSIRGQTTAPAGKGGIKGTVRTADGQPASGLLMVLYKGDARPSGGGGGGGRRGSGGSGGGTRANNPPPLTNATTDSQGNYKFGNLDPGKYTVYAGGPPAAGNARGGGSRGNGSAEVKDGATATVDIQLAPAPVRSGGTGGQGGGGGGGRRRGG